MFLFTFYSKLRKKSIVHFKGHIVHVVIWSSLEVGELVLMEVMRASTPTPRVPLLALQMDLATTCQSRALAALF